MQEKTVAILGAGITGLTTAFYLKKKGIPFTLFEKKDRVGGVILSHTQGDFTWETGPNTGVIGNPEVMELFEDLNALDILETAPSLAGNRYIWKAGKLHALPSGIFSGLITPLFSWQDKLLGLPLEPFRSRGTDPNENLSSLVRRRLGSSILDYAVDPFVSGVYAGNPDVLIPKYALPKLYNLEQNYGSFIRGAIKKMKEPRTERDRKATKKTFSTKGGLSRLVEALEKAIGQEHFVLGCPHLEVRPTADGQYEIHNTQTVHGPFQEVIATFGADHIGEAMPFLDKNLAAHAGNVHYAKVAEVAVGFRKWKGRPLDGFGALIPSREKRNILGALFMSSLFQGRAPKEGALIATFVGGLRHPELVHLDDDSLRTLVRRELSEILSISDFSPHVFDISRHSEAIPSMTSTPSRMRAYCAIEKQHPGIILGGNGINGIGMADRIRQGKELAGRIQRTP